jgi:hypothetical protein
MKVSLVYAVVTVANRMRRSLEGVVRNVNAVYGLAVECYIGLVVVVVTSFHLVAIQSISTVARFVRTRSMCTQCPKTSTYGRIP